MADDVLICRSLPRLRGWRLDNQLRKDERHNSDHCLLQMGFPVYFVMPDWLLIPYSFELLSGLLWLFAGSGRCSGVISARNWSKTLEIYAVLEEEYGLEVFFRVRHIYIRSPAICPR